MDWNMAINILKSRRDYDDSDGDLAATFVINEAGLPLAAYDWLLEGDFDGDETPASILADWTNN